MSHITAFLFTAALGFCGGAVYDLTAAPFSLFRKRAIGFAAELIFCLLFTGIYLFVSVRFSLPPFRFYLFLGCAAGFLLYSKTIHKIVAFFARKGYNKYVHRVQKRREKRKCRIGKMELPKKKQSASR